MSSLEYAKERAKGLYSGCKYPNLVEAHGYFPTGYFANVTEELMRAVFRGEEDLTAEEMWKIAHYNNIPLSVLICPKMIMLDMGRIRHRKMVAEVNNLYIRLKCMAREGNQKAEKYLEWGDWDNQSLLRAAHNNKLSYIHYLGAKRQLSDYILFAKPEPAKRGITAKKGGATK